MKKFTSKIKGPLETTRFLCPKLHFRRVFDFLLYHGVATTLKKTKNQTKKVQRKGRRCRLGRGQVISHCLL